MPDILSNIINIPIIPVLLMPVTGLICLTFYNRATSMHARLRMLQKELRELHLDEPRLLSPREKEMSQALFLEVQRLHGRSRLIAFALVCCLLSIILFALCALFVVLSLYFPWTVTIALLFWFFGPVLICIGIVSGILELLRSHASIETETILIKKWYHQ